MKHQSNEKMKVAVLRCRDCGHELNRTDPFPDHEESKVRVTSGLAGGACPRGCRSTFRDMNLNTRLELCDAEA